MANRIFFFYIGHNLLKAKIIYIFMSILKFLESPWNIVNRPAFLMLNLACLCLIY